ncbi:hypothetical protein B0H17DRAFT_1099690 [Mycena rosella]|uniref:Uncharacterized protein n=1 Tax=Mycena rosella TaxID=1033263 RepID=A0AAD7CQX9_MYCRO|nr:hypothetical protein B0H17DRAFT_1099690 [Mycena rosella]
MSYTISSPRAPRSSHHRSPSTTRTSPRQAERVRPFGGHRPNQPNYEGSAAGAGTPLVPGNLTDDRDVFNVDGGAAVLEAGGETYQEPVAPAGRRRFVGGFMAGIRERMGRGGGGGIAMPEPAVVHADEREYEAVAPGENEKMGMGMGAAAEGRYDASPSRYAASPDGRYAASPDGRYASPSPEGRYAARSPNVHYAPTPDARYAAASPDGHYAMPAPPSADPQYRESPSRERHHRQESVSSTSETVHVTQEHYDGTTIANHDVIPPEQYDSPELVEPQLGSDYAKMQSPPRSEASFNSYMSRINRFFQTLNDMPWIAPERVTVDYIPGKARLEQGGGATARPRAARRPVISWYNSNVPQGSIDLLSGGSTSTPLDEFAQARPLDSEPPVFYANNKPVPVAASEPPPMARGMGTPTSNRPRRVPVPAVDPDLERGAGSASSESEHGGAWRAPRYPNGGYVPYDQQPVPMAQMYTGSSAASSQRVPRH